jgi:hypothetical protein
MEVIKLLETIRTPFLDTFFSLITKLGEEDIKVTQSYLLNYTIKKGDSGSPYSAGTITVNGMTASNSVFNLYVNEEYKYSVDGVYENTDKPINLAELEECVDLEKFYLAMAKQLIEITNTTLKSDKAVHNSFVFVEKYIMAVKAARGKGTYSLSIETISMDGRKIKYTVDDAIREYNEIKVANPEFSVYHFEADGRDYRDIDTVRDFTSEMEDYIESKKLQASWNFIRNGKKEVTPLDEDVVIRLKNKKQDKKKVTREEKLQAITDRMGFLDHTDYVYKMTGKDNFEGYVGYIYSNGIVVFEKFYKSVENHEPSTSNATYVMNFNNFVQMSKLTKTDIMAYIKNGGTDVRRVYHTNNWVDKMLQIITGKSYDEKAMDKINRLISEGKINKKKK